MATKAFKPVSGGEIERAYYALRILAADDNRFRVESFGDVQGLQPRVETVAATLEEHPIDA
ncbi:hypothetical protein [Rhodococcus opacus]|uniref:Uncharacterized protein n=1 Tax=Rhodococcus opacus TaxID=37919 RepID=A0A2S8IYT0_RHOOP|nr:hypothetical protein [Rhodococcus opacus]PQP19512.1 hypothetical protein C5613_30005 [Rhodococcus opacus]